MNKVLQRTRPSASAATPSSSKLRGFLRSFLPGRRALMLLLLVGGGAALSTQMLQGLRRPGAEPGPGSPGGAGGSGESAASVEPSEASTPVFRPSPGQVASVTARAANPDKSVKAGAAPGSSSPTATPGASRRTARQSADAAASQAPALAGRWRPATPRPSVQAPQGVFGAFGSDDLPVAPGPDGPLAEAPAAAAPSLRGPAAVRQLGTVSLSDLDPFQGVPCSDSTAALPPARPPEEAWLPGSDAASLAGADALDPIPVPPIYSESPELAAGPASPSVQAHRNSLCLKQPAGRN